MNTEELKEKFQELLFRMTGTETNLQVNTAEVDVGLVTLEVEVIPFEDDEKNEEIFYAIESIQEDTFIFDGGVDMHEFLMRHLFDKEEMEYEKDYFLKGDKVIVKL